VASSFIVQSLSMLWLFSFVSMIQKEMMMVWRCLPLVFVLPTVWIGLLGASIGAMVLEVAISATVPLVELMLGLDLIQEWISKAWAWSSVPMKSSTCGHQFPRRGKCGHWFGRRQRSTSVHPSHSQNKRAKQKEWFSEDLEDWQQSWDRKWFWMEHSLYGHFFSEICNANSGLI
jgi:hypothetical protein